MSAWRGIKRIQMMIAEMVGTYFIVLTYGLSSTESPLPTPPGMPGDSAANTDPLGVVATGFALLSQTYAFSHVSLAQFNPALTLALALTQSISIVDAMVSVGMQCLAALMAGFTMFAIADHVTAPMPATDDFAGNLSAAALELLFTFAIVLVALNALREMPNSYYGIAVGLTVVAGMYSAKQYSGGAFNPALALGLQAACALGPGDCSMRSQVIYWVATLAGGALAAGAYMLMNKSVRLVVASGPVERATQLEEAPPSVVAVLFVEFVGTFFLTLVSCLANSCIAVGFILTAMVYMGTRVSGGEFNPAVTFGVALRSRMPLHGYVRVVLKALIQIMGALLAGFVAYAISDSVKYPNPDGAHGPFNAFVFEALFTTSWIMVVLCVATPTSDLEAEDGTDDHAPQSYFGLAIGLTVAAGVASSSKLGDASGGVFNPAVGTGLCVTDALTGGSSGKYLWIYWAGPLLASLVAALLFSLTHSRQERFGYRPV